MLEKRWNIKEAPDKKLVEDLMRAINASESLATLLVQRGIRDFESARRYFNPSLSQLHDPFLMKDMDRAVERITDAINREENILVYGDYDVDGTTAVSLLYDFLAQDYPYVSYYIPDRYREGYGVSEAGVHLAADNDISLIIALDCGVKAHGPIAMAKEMEIDFIVCDHHLPPETLPEALAILNPLQSDCMYPFKALCGCGIGFKLVQALLKSWKQDVREAYQYLDLVAIAVAADIVSMTGENRVMTAMGMRLMQDALRPGLARMLEGAGLAEHGRLSKSTISVSDLVFKIGPRLNAAGRMDHGSRAVELLTSPTQTGAAQIADMINRQNLERREVDKSILEEARAMLDQNAAALEAKSTVLYAEHWHKGVVGIAASRLQDYYYRPTVILTRSNGKASGSARSVPGFDVHAAIESCSDLLLNFGGHPAAAGMTLDVDKIGDFQKRFEEYVQQTIDPLMLVPEIEIDLEIDLAQVTQRFFDQLNRMAPFGPNNMRPQFVTHELLASSKTKKVGDGSHLKLEVYQRGNRQRTIGGIAFGMGDLAERMSKGDAFSAVYSLEANEYRGHTSIQMVVKDIRFTGV